MFCPLALAAMDAERQDWTDGRLDDLQQEMRAGFARVDADLRELRTGVNSRIDSLQRTILQFGAALIVSQAGLILSLVLTKL